jgi:hypothetical protein
MRPDRRRLVTSPPCVAALLIAASAVLPGCPPSDDYFIETTASGTGGSGSAGGSGATGGSGGSPIHTAGEGGAAAVGSSQGGASGAGGGASGSGGGAGSGGSATTGWVAASVPPGGFSPREHSAFISIGNQLFVWGGRNESGTALNSGALYDPRTDEWRMIANDANTPSPRCEATAVWTGSVVVVWGGYEPATERALSDGAVYDPVEDAWRAMADGPFARVAPIGGGAEGRALFWAGRDSEGSPLRGLDVYDIENDAWSFADASEEPTLREEAAWAVGMYTFWTYGGRLDAENGSDRAAYYSMSQNEWNTLPEGATVPRWGSFGAFVGGNFYVWGGRDVSTNFDDGVVFPLIDLESWAGIDTSNAPSARYAAFGESGWVFPVDDESFVVVGGLEAAGDYLHDGAFYDTTEDAWTALEAWPGSASHAFGAAGWVGGELVIWGGRDGDSLTNTGWRYRPPS